MLDKVARGLCYASLAVPVTLLPGFFFPFVTTRAVLFRSCVALGLALVLVKAQLRRMVWEERRDPVFLALLSFLVALALSAAFGVSPWRSFYGDYERMGGVWAWLNLVGFYLLLRATMTERRHWRRLLVGAVAIGALVGALGILERFQEFLGVSLSFGGTGSPVVTTIGNGGIAAAYLVTVIGFALYLAMTTTRLAARLVYLASVPLVFATLLLTGNRSSLLGMMAAGIVAATFYLFATRDASDAKPPPAGRSPVWRRLAGGLLVASAVGVAALFAASRLLSPSQIERLPRTVERLVQTAPGGGDASRLLQWKASWAGFRQRPLLGYGPENYHVVWGEHMDPEIYRHDPASRWDRAHNAYLEALATSGMVGALALLSLLAAVVLTLVRANRSGAMSPASCALFAGIFSAYAFYLVFWFFDLNSVMLIVAAAAYVSSRAGRGPIMSAGERKELSLRSKLLLAGASVAIAGTLYIHGYETLRVAALLARAGDPRANADDAFRDFRQIFRSPAPLSYHTLLIYSQHLRSVSPRFEAIRRDSVRGAALDETFSQSFRVVEREILRDPRNERVAVHKARIAMLAAQYYGAPQFFEAAIGTLKRAVAVSPRRIQTRLVLANAYVIARRPDAALAQLDTALRTFPAYQPTHRHLAATYVGIGDIGSAAPWLVSALDMKSEVPTKLVSDVAIGLMRQGRRTDAAALLKRFFLHQYGPMFLWKPTMLRTMPAEDIQLLVLLAALQRELGEGDSQSRTLASSVRTMCPPSRSISRSLTFDVCGSASSLIAPDAHDSRFRSGGIDLASRYGPPVSSLKSESST